MTYAEANAAMDRGERVRRAAWAPGQFVLWAHRAFAAEQADVPGAAVWAPAFVLVTGETSALYGASTEDRESDDWMVVT